MRLTCLALLLAVAVLLGVPSQAKAEDGVLGEIDRLLKSSADFLDDNMLFGKFRFSPRITQSVIYDDNIWQNDVHGGNTVRTFVEGPGGALVETEGTPEKRGREWDFISRSTIGLALEARTNPTFSKLFHKQKLKLIDYEVSFNEFMRRGYTDSIEQDIQTDLFTFLSDLFNVQMERGQAYGPFATLHARYRDRTNPIDLVQRALGPALTGVPILPPVLARDDEFRWREVYAGGGLGYRGNNFDVRGGYDFEWMEFSNDFYAQADHKIHRGTLEVGVNPPPMPEDRVYLRGTYENLDFTKAILHDADIWDVRLGFEGPVLTKKLFVLAEVGYKHWDSNEGGTLIFNRGTGGGGPSTFQTTNPDNKDFSGLVLRGQLSYQPWEGQKTQFQLEGGRDVTWSAISNFKEERFIRGSVMHDLWDGKLTADASLGYFFYDPSVGPERKLLEAGAGLVYHLIPGNDSGKGKVDLELRYLFRHQLGHDEVELAFLENDNPVTLKFLRTDSDFFQNQVSFTIYVTF